MTNARNRGPSIHLYGGLGRTTCGRLVSPKIKTELIDDATCLLCLQAQLRRYTEIGNPQLVAMVRTSLTEVRRSKGPPHV